MGLDKIEELLEDLENCQAHLCEELWWAGRNMESKGVFNRCKLKAEDINKVSKC
jgi:hypothetical protein